MRTLVPIGCLLLLACLPGCPRRDQPPESSYDPDLVETAREMVAEQERQDQAARSQPVQNKEHGECSWQTGGCPPGTLCWDSWYCKKGFDDQCSAAGDKRCHKVCTDDSDCPRDMPRCSEQPIFRGSERGTLEKLCVAEQK